MGSAGKNQANKLMSLVQCDSFSSLSQPYEVGNSISFYRRGLERSLVNGCGQV